MKKSYFIEKNFIINQGWAQFTGAHGSIRAYFLTALCTAVIQTVQLCVHKINKDNTTIREN